MLLVLPTRISWQLIVCALAVPHFTLARFIKHRSATPSALSISPSQSFDGDDGPWSTFTIQIGNPPQNVKVLVSTYATQTWAIDAKDGCVSGDLLSCDKSRGGLYNYSSSTSWVANEANLTTQIYDLGLESNLGYFGKGRYGFDDITLGFQGSSGPTLKNQTVASVATKSFFLGIFGLKPMSSNFTDFEHTVPSFMQNLKSQSMIPSTSWAYTAGNQYRNNEVLGSLTLGGYDASRFTPNNLTFTFSTNDQPDLAVQISSIKTSNSSSSQPTTLLSTPITTYLDSTIPYLYLPRSTCDLIASSFGLSYNSTTQLYTISSVQHSLLIASNPTINFTLTRPDSLGSPINIIFPYLAFALQATSPLVPTTTLYFPMKIANDSSQYRLGRAFFQEAYIIADYERRNFSVSQTRYDSSTQNIISILPPSNTTSTNPTSTKKTTLSTAAIAGIASSATIIIILLLLLTLYCCIYKRKHASPSAPSEPFASNPTSPQPPPTDTYIKPELDAQPPTTITHLPPPQEIDSLPSPLTPAPMPKQVYFELPAREEVAAEVAGSSNLSSTLLAEQEEMIARREGSGNANRRERIRWSWDRRRRASRGESAGSGLGSVDESESGWDERSRIRTMIGTGTEGSQTLYSPSEVAGGYREEGKGKEIEEEEDDRRLEGEEGDNRTEVGTMSSLSSGWVSSAAPAPR